MQQHNHLTRATIGVGKLQIERSQTVQHHSLLTRPERLVGDLQLDSSHRDRWALSLTSRVYRPGASVRVRNGTKRTSRAAWAEAKGRTQLE